MDERLREVYRRVSSLRRTGTAAESFDQFCRVLDAVENELSGIPKQVPPPPTGDGRMYCPLPDRTEYRSDGSIEAVTAGHTIRVSANGTIEITNRRTGEVEFAG